MTTREIARRVSALGVRITRYYSAHGLYGSLKHAVHIVVRRTMRGARYLTEWQFDRKYGVQTRGRHFTNAAHDLHGERHPYQPVPLQRLSSIIDSLKLPTADYWFVDLGSGMGGALIVAAKMGFRGLVGVEFDGALHEIAKRNVVSFGLREPELASRITLLQQDATKFRFPEEAPLLVFMFNPFGPDTMRTVMGNLEESLRLTPRKAFIVYYFPTQGAIVEELSSFSTVHRNERYAVYAHWPRRNE